MIGVMIRPMASSSSGIADLMSIRIYLLTHELNRHPRG
jgi:hypothetical protein